MRRRLEQRQLPTRGGVGRPSRQATTAVLIQVVRFECLQDHSRPVDHFARDTGQPRHVDPVTLVRRTLDNLVQKHHLLVLLVHRHVQIHRTSQCPTQFGQLVVVRRKQRTATHSVVQVFGDRPRQRDPVVGARAATDLVEHHQAVTGGRVEYPRRLGHLDHERTLPLAQLVTRSDPGKHSIGHAH